MSELNYDDPERYRKLASGAILEKSTSRIVANPGGGKFAITRERSQLFHSLRKAQGVKSALMGLVDAAREKGIELPDPESMSDQELIAAGGDAVRLFSKHMALQFLKSANLRGMGEVYSKLTLPLLGSMAEDEDEKGSLSELRWLVHELAEMARNNDRETVGDIIDAE